MGGHHYDKNGEPISLTEWARLFEDRDYQRVRSTMLAGIHVSTVWLGLDHSFSDGGTPVIFETMVFGKDDDEEICVRYCTEDEAIIGHIAMVEEVLAKFPSDEEAAIAAKSTEGIARDLEAL